MNRIWIRAAICALAVAAGIGLGTTLSAQILPPQCPLDQALQCSDETCTGDDCKLEIRCHYGWISDVSFASYACCTSTTSHPRGIPRCCQAEYWQVVCRRRDGGECPPQYVRRACASKPKGYWCPDSSQACTGLDEGQ